MKSRVAQYQRCCKDLVIKLNTRLNLGGSHQGARIEAAVKEFSMYRLHNNVCSLRIDGDGCRCQYSKDGQGRPAGWLSVAILCDDYQ